MTEKQMNKLGFYKTFGNKYSKFCDGREITIIVTKLDDERSIWNAIYDSIYEEGLKDGNRSKAKQIKKLLNIEDD